MSILPIYAVVRVDDILNNINLVYSNDYLKSREVRRNVAKSSGCSFGRTHYNSSINLLGRLHKGTGIGLDDELMASLIEIYSPDSEVEEYSSDRLNYHAHTASSVYFHPKKNVQIKWENVEWSNTGLPMNIIIYQNESGATYAARISHKGRSIVSNVFATSEEAVLAQKQMTLMKRMKMFD